jgi:hypothetical protein
MMPHERSAPTTSGFLPVLRLGRKNGKRTNSSMQASRRTNPSSALPCFGKGQ